MRSIGIVYIGYTHLVVLLDVMIHYMRFGELLLLGWCVPEATGTARQHSTTSVICCSDCSAVLVYCGVPVSSDSHAAGSSQSTRIVADSEQYRPNQMNRVSLIADTSTFTRKIWPAASSTRHRLFLSIIRNRCGDRDDPCRSSLVFPPSFLVRLHHPIILKVFGCFLVIFCLFVFTLIFMGFSSLFYSDIYFRLSQGYIDQLSFNLPNRANRPQFVSWIWKYLSRLSLNAATLLTHLPPNNKRIRHKKKL